MAVAEFWSNDIEQIELSNTFFNYRRLTLIPTELKFGSQLILMIELRRVAVCFIPGVGRGSYMPNASFAGQCAYHVNRLPRHHTKFTVMVHCFPTFFSYLSEDIVKCKTLPQQLQGVVRIRPL